jgi:hypothetical protein
MCVSIANVVGLVVDYTICKKGEVVSPKVFRINWHLLIIIIIIITF